MKTKLKAFTLAEMIVVLIITSIVVGLGFTILNLVQKHMAIVQNNLKQNTEIHLLNAALEIDFSKYPDISFNPKKKQLFLASPLDSVSYYFHEKAIIRIHDTLKLTVEDKAIYFQGEACLSGKVDALKLRFANTKQNIFVFKQNAASTLMN